MSTLTHYPRFYQRQALKPSSSRRLGSVSTTVLVLFALVGCRNVAGPDPAALVDASVGATVPGGSVARWRVDLRRVEADIPRAVLNCRWAVLRVRRSGAEAADPASGAKAEHVSARALLPNERRATIEAAVEADGRVVVSIRVGERGDAPAERQFLRELGQVLRGPPARQYQGRFALPE